MPDSKIDFSKLAREGESSKLAKAMNVILTLICIALAGVIIYTSFFSGEDDSSETPQAAAQSQAVNVSVSPSYIGTYTKISRLNGEIRRDGLDISIMPDITTTAIVTDILVKEGDHIAAGDVVAHIDASRPGTAYRPSPVIARSSGIVISVDASPGQTVSATTSVATITSNEDLVIEAAIPEKFLGSLRTGMTASFETVAYPGRMYSATLTYISPSLSTSSRTAAIKLSIDEEAEELKSGMYVKLYLETERIDNALIVPSAALDEYIGDDIVYTAEDGTAARKIVTVGSDNGTEAVILDGLEAGELVITAGNITDGSIVNAIRAEGD